MNNLPLTAALLGAALALTACATPPPANGISVGTLRHGWIAGFYSADTPHGELPRCIAELAPEQLAGRRFVKIHYRHVRTMLVEVAELPPATDPALARLDAHVELVANDCDAGQLSRITQFLP